MLICILYRKIDLGQACTEENQPKSLDGSVRIHFFLGPKKSQDSSPKDVIIRFSSIR